MEFTSIIELLQASGPAEWMRSSLKAMPIVEALHVLAIAVVFGTVLVVDLRLLGYPNLNRKVTVVSDEMLKLTWFAFVLAVITGVLMFLPNAATYVANMAFRYKLLAMLAAGLNMLVFQFGVYRSVARWDQGASTPMAARTAGLLSISLWIAVILLGRWIGFTKGYDFTVPDDVQFEF